MIPNDDIAFDEYEIRLGVLAALAQDEFIDEPVQELTETSGVVGAVDDVSVVFLVEGGLGAELATEEFGGIGRRARKGPGDIGHVRDYGFDAVAFTFDFGEEDWHAAEDMVS
jgi:hypothetical protein